MQAILMGLYLIKEKVLIPGMDIHFFSFKIAKMSRDSLVLRPQRKKYKSPFDYRRICNYTSIQSKSRYT